MHGIPQCHNKICSQESVLLRTPHSAGIVVQGLMIKSKLP